MVYNAESMSIVFAVRQYVNPDSPAQGTCYEERITQFYDFSKRNVIDVSLRTKHSMCNAITDPFSFEGHAHNSMIDDPYAQNLGVGSMLNNPDSNLDPNELALYLMVILFASL